MSYLALSSEMIEKHNEHAKNDERRAACAVCARFGCVEIDADRAGKVIAVNPPASIDPANW